MPARFRECPRCGHRHYDMAIKDCELCFTPLRAERFHMNKQRIQYVHVLAMAQKGLTHEEYKDNLRAVGVESSKHMKRQHYYDFLARMKRLPDAPKKRAA